MCYCDVRTQIEGENPSVVGCYCTVLLGCWGQYWTAGPERLRGRRKWIGASEGTRERYIAYTASEEWCCVRWDGTAVCD